MNSGATRPPSMFQQIGGEEPLRRLVNAFYDIVETHPDGEPVHKLHQEGFGVAHLREAQFEFLAAYLATLPKDRRLVLAAHIPFFDEPGRETFRRADRERLFALLQAFPKLLLLFIHDFREGPTHSASYLDLRLH